MRNYNNSDFEDDEIEVGGDGTFNPDKLEEKAVIQAIHGNTLRYPEDAKWKEQKMWNKYQKWLYSSKKSKKDKSC